MITGGHWAGVLCIGYWVRLSLLFKETVVRDYTAGILYWPYTHWWILDFVMNQRDCSV